MKLVVGNIYKWKHNDLLVVYVGKYGCWNQFSLDGSMTIWCELLDSDLWMLEEVQ